MPRTKCGFNDSAVIKGTDLLVVGGPTILVNIGFDSTYNQDAKPPVIPVSAIQGVLALVDTGATECCIDDQLAVQIGLPVIDRRKISGVGGVHEVNIYIAQIHVPSLLTTMYGQFAGVTLAAGGQRHNAILGRSFLRGFTMIYTGATGDVELYS